MHIVRIVRVYFLEDDIVDGDIPMECYESAWTEDCEVADIHDAAYVLRYEGLTFAATGSHWAADPDGSYVVDYRTGRRCEVTAHFDWQDWSPAELAELVELVG